MHLCTRAFPISLHILLIHTGIYTYVHMHIYTCRPAYTYTYTHAYTRGCIKYVVDLLGYRVRITAPYPEIKVGALVPGARNLQSLGPNKVQRTLFSLLGSAPEP